MEAQSSDLDHIHLNAPPSYSYSMSSDTALLSPTRSQLLDRLNNGKRPLHFDAVHNASARSSPRSADFKSVALPDDHGESAGMDLDDPMELAGEEGAAYTDGRGGSTLRNLRRLLPLPSPATPTGDNVSTSLQSSRARRDKNQSDRRAHGLEPPKVAIRLLQDKHADFRPWTGDGVEDILNENVMRTGFADKPANSGQSESNMARPVIWPTLKTKKNGLPILSTLFVQIMDKRQALGRCTAPSTFRPPPRVTLTDTKREAWLRDLASATVPLRRLSRTIPHGIRGKPLLEQCLDKKIPIPRAIWLVKCIGAQEIRAFRRKGTAGSVVQSTELKWVKEWTISVVQFIQAAVVTCGQKGWQAQMQYATKLATALFAEDLLDQRSFLDWIIDSFAKSSVDQLPLWLMFVQLYRTHLTSTQSRGRQFATAILSHIHRMRTSRIEHVFESLGRHLIKLLEMIAVSRPACLTGTSDWALTNLELRSILGYVSDESHRIAIRSVLSRGTRLHTSSSGARSKLRPPRLALFEYLDSVRMNTPLGTIVAECQRICPDSAACLAAVVDWASSVYRTGYPRVFLAIQILRQYRANSVPLEEPVIACLNGRRSPRDRRAFQKIITELVHSGHFHLGTYLQWLVSSGQLSDKASTHTSVLFSVSPKDLSPQCLNLRNAIIARFGTNSSHPQTVQALQGWLTTLIEGSEDHPLGPTNAMDQFASLHVAEQNSLCSFIVNKLEKISQKNADAISSRVFVRLRSIVEQTGNFSSLHMILKLQIPASTTEALATLAATVQRHMEVFGFMGHLQGLTVLLLQRHARLRQSNNLDKVLISTLIDLCRQQTSFTSCISTLESDLNVCEQQDAAAVCSPASDSMLTVQSGEINADADIDRILASGNMMDEQLLARLFSSIVERTVKWTTTGSVTLTNPCRWFSQLRMFDPITFDRHTNNLVSKLAANAGTDQVRAILMALVSSGCLKMDNAVKAFEKRLDTLEAASAPQIARFAVGTLQTFLPLTDLDGQKDNLEIYRFQIFQAAVCKHNRALILRFVWHGLTALSETTNPIFSASAVAWLTDCLVQDPQLFVKALHTNEHVPAPKGTRLNKLIWTISRGSAVTETVTPDEDTMTAISNMVQCSDELRLPFIKTLLGHILPEFSQEQRSTLQRAFQDAISMQGTLWSQLLDGTGSEVARSLYESSSAAVLEAVLEDYNTDYKTSSSILDERLNVAAITSAGHDEASISIQEKICDGLRIMTDRLDEVARDANGLEQWSKGVIRLIQLINICIASVSADKRTSPTVQRLLMLICSLNARGDLQLMPLSMATEDCICLLNQSFNADQLISTYKKLPDSAQISESVKFLLGYEDTDMKWLYLGARVPMQSSAVTASPTKSQGSTMSASSPREHHVASAASTPLPSPSASRGHMSSDIKYTRYMLQRWELMQDPTPNLGENDTSLSLGLFAARKVL